MARAPKISIALIERRTFLRNIISQGLGLIDSTFEILTFSSPEELIDAIRDGGGIDAVILCIGAEDATERTLGPASEIAAACSGAKLFILSDSSDADLVAAAARAGVRGYLTTDLDFALLAEAILFVCSGGFFFPPAAIMSLADRHATAPQPAAAQGGEGERPDTHAKRLTPRQLEVLSCLQEGLANKAIAHRLKMCENTVKVHVWHIMKKLGATNRTQAVSLANSLLLRPVCQDQ